MKKLVLVLALTVLPVSGALAQLMSQTSPAPDRDPNLISPETGVDYKLLRDLLAEGKWRKANETTFDLILKASDREAAGWMTAESMEKFPCWDMGTIDKLWKQYSKGHFGFSVQFPIYLSTGNQPGKVDVKAYQSFGDRVGWRKGGEWILFKDNLTYDLGSPKGHLPNPRYEYEIYGGRLEYTTLTKRAVDCNLPGFAITERSTN